MVELIDVSEVLSASIIRANFIFLVRIRCCGPLGFMKQRISFASFSPCISVVSSPFLHPPPPHQIFLVPVLLYLASHSRTLTFFHGVSPTIFVKYLQTLSTTFSFLFVLPIFAHTPFSVVYIIPISLYGPFQV